MSLDAPEAHTTHVLLELVADVLAKTADLNPDEIPGALLDAAVKDGPFDFGALYAPGATGALEYVRGRGFPTDLTPSFRTAFGALESLEECRTTGEALVLDSQDTEEADAPGLEEALGASSALIIPLLSQPKDCPVLFLAAILHDVTGTGEGLCRSLQATYTFARARHEQLQRSRRATKRWDRLVHAVSQALVFADPSGEIVQANRAAGELFGVSSSELAGRFVSELMPGLSYRSEEWSGNGNLPGGTERVLVRTAILPEDEEGRRLYLHTVERPAAPPPSFAPLDAVGPLDTSTGLPDKETFQGELVREMELARRYNGWCSVLVIDLDGLSPLRQSQGEEALTMLRAIGEALQARLRRSDRLGRLSGDSFGVLLSRGTREQGLALGTSLLEIVRNTSARLGHGLTASIGISYHPDDGDDVDTLLETAFGAMMLAKRGGGDQALVWNKDLMTSRAKGGGPRPARLPRVTDSQVFGESGAPGLAELGPAEARDGPSRPPARRASGPLPAFERDEATIPPAGRPSGSHPRVAAAGDADAELIEEAMSPDNLVIALPEDPSAEDSLEQVSDLNNLVIALPEDPSDELDT